MNMINANNIQTNENLAKTCVVSCLRANHANMLPLVEILRACAQERPYREVEEEVNALPIMHMTHQNAHVLSKMLVNCGGLQAIPVEEEPRPKQGTNEQPFGATRSAQPDEGCAVVEEAEAVLKKAAPQETGSVHNTDQLQPEIDEAELEDQPTDYLLVITPAGAAALSDFEPTKRFADLMAGEPATYADAYRQILLYCQDGATFDDIESTYLHHPAMSDPKPVFPGYFVSKLETVGGIAWESHRWHTTAAGRQMAESLQSNR